MKINARTRFLICCRPLRGLVESYLFVDLGFRCAPPQALGKGFTGLAITTGSVVTLFVVMQVTGRIRWADKFSLKPAEQPAGELT